MLKKMYEILKSWAPLLFTASVIFVLVTLVVGATACQSSKSLGLQEGAGGYKVIDHTHTDRPCDCRDNAED